MTGGDGRQSERGITACRPHMRVAPALMQLPTLTSTFTSPTMRAGWRLVAGRSYKADNRAHLGDAVGVAGRSFPPPSRLPSPERKQRRRRNALHFNFAVSISSSAPTSVEAPPLCAP